MVKITVDLIRKSCTWYNNNHVPIFCTLYNTERRMLIGTYNRKKLVKSTILRLSSGRTQ